MVESSLHALQFSANRQGTRGYLSFRLSGHPERSEGSHARRWTIQAKPRDLRIVGEVPRFARDDISRC